MIWIIGSELVRYLDKDGDVVTVETTVDDKLVFMTVDGVGVCTDATLGTVK